MGSDAAASKGPTGAVSVLNFELFPAHSLSICLVEGVTNAAELRQEVLQQKFEASFIDASMVSPFPRPHMQPRCSPAQTFRPQF